MPDLYGKLNKEVHIYTYDGVETDTAKVTVDNKTQDISVDVKRVPNELTLTTINGDTYNYDGSEPASFDIRTQVTDKVEEGNNLPVTSDAVKGYVDSKAGALEYVGGEGNFTNIDGSVTVKGRLNVDDGIYSPVTSDDPNFVPNNKSVDDKITASEQKLIDERIGAFTRTEDKLFTDVTGGMTIKGKLNVDGGITSASAPADDTDVANKGYVDSAIQMEHERADAYADTKVSKVTSTAQNDRAYTVTATGEQTVTPISVGAYSSTIAIRGTDGKLNVGNPTDNNNATNKKYVDDSINEEKTRAENTYLKMESKSLTAEDVSLYAVIPEQAGESALDRQTLIAVSTAEEGYTVAKRTSDGRLLATAPMNELDVTNKQYVDDSLMSDIDITSIYSASHDDTGIHINADANMHTQAGAQYKGSAEMLIPLVGKDGVTIEDEPNNIIAVKADVEAIQKDMAGRFGNNCLWYTTTTGEPSGFGVTDAGDSGAIPVITDGLSLPETIPNENYVAVHKKYVDDKFVAKISTTTATGNILYGRQSDGTETAYTIQNIEPLAGTIVQRTAGGVVRVGNPVADNDATTKKYVDDGFVAKVTNTTTSTKAYIAKTDGSQGTIDVATGVAANTLAQRGAGGVLAVGTPTGDNDATTKKYVDDADAKKLNLTGGAITGSLAIQGDLTVTGTTTTEKAQTLAVKDSVIITNADGVELGATLSGIAIRKDGENTYGVMYDPSGNSVKLGLGTLDAENKFTFNESGTDGKPIATRDDSGNLTDGDLVRWDGTTKSLVDSGKKTDDFVEKVTVTEGSNLAYVAKNNGTQGTLPIATNAYSNTIAQRTTNGRLLVGTAVEDSDAMPKKQVDDGFVAKIAPPDQFVYAYGYSGNTPVLLKATSSATANQLAYRGTGGVLSVGTPTEDAHATTKKYVDDADSKKVNLIDGLTEGAVVYATETADGKTIGIPYSSNSADPDSIVRRMTDGSIIVGTPVGDNSESAVNIEYANANYVAKQTTTAPNQSYLYAYDSNGDRQFQITGSPNAGSVPIRGNGGRLQVGTPVGVNDATTKAYVDNLNTITITAGA